MKDLDNLAALKGRIEDGEKETRVTGLSGSAQSYFFSQFLSDLKVPSLVVLPEKKDAETLFKKLSFYMSVPNGQIQSEEVRLYEFPTYDISPLTGLSPHREIVSKRLETLYALMTNRRTVVVASLEAASYRILPKEALVKSLEYFEIGEEVDRKHVL